MFFLDDDFRITRIAGSLAHRLDKQQEEVIGEPITELLPSHSTGSLEEILSRVQESGGSHTVECRLGLSDTDIPVEIEVAHIEGESGLGSIIGTVDWEDITGLNADIPSHLVRLQNFIELFEDPAVVYEITESDAIVKAINPAFEETFGYQADHIVGESLDDQIVPVEYQNEARQLNKQVADGRVTHELVTRRTAGGVRRFSSLGMPVSRESGNPYGLSTFTELTNEQQAQQHLQVLHRVLRHNLRNELTVILGMTQRIRNETREPDIETTAEAVITHIENLDDISEKARIAEEIFGDSASDTTVELGKTTEMVLSEARERWPDAEIEADVETPLPVSTGPKLRDALENLVENAIVHNGESPTVRVRTRTKSPIHPTTRASGRHVIVTIEDNGPGIPKNDRAVIFDHEEVNDLRHGSGLGLWITRWIIEAADGAISYDRSEGWTTITLRLPLATDVSGRPEGDQATDSTS